MGFFVKSVEISKMKFELHYYFIPHAYLAEKICRPQRLFNTLFLFDTLEYASLRFSTLFQDTRENKYGFK